MKRKKEKVLCTKYSRDLFLFSRNVEANDSLTFALCVLHFSEKDILYWIGNVYTRRE